MLYLPDGDPWSVPVERFNISQKAKIMTETPQKSKQKKAQKPPLQKLGSGDHFKHGVSMKHERLVGRLVIEWSRLEAIMQDVIWSILDIGLEDGRVLTARSTAQIKLQWLRSFSRRHIKGSELEALNDILSAIEELQDDRNFIAHASWGTMKSNGDPVGMSLRQKSEPSEIISETFPDWRMRQIIARIMNARDALVCWRQKHESLPGRRTPPLYGDTYSPPLDPEPLQD